MKRRPLLLLALAAGAALAAPLPYDESADAKAALAAARSPRPRPQIGPVLVIFGANWCEDCRALDQSLKQGRNAALIGREFEVVKVDVGRFNRNLDITRAYGDPIKKGFPPRSCSRPTTAFSTRPGPASSPMRAA